MLYWPQSKMNNIIFWVGPNVIWNSWLNSWGLILTLVFNYVQEIQEDGSYDTPS